MHQIRNSLKYVPYTDKKELANDLKTIYQASTEEIAYTNLLELDEKWKNKYPGAIQSWIDNWEVLSVFFKFSAEIRKIIVWSISKFEYISLCEYIGKFV